MDVPIVGLTKGLFEIFIPGAFLFLNFMFFAVRLPYLEESTKTSIATMAASPILATVVILCFGYLSGVLLRLCKTGITDKMSGYVCWMVYGRWKSETKSYYLEPFPYFGYIWSLCEGKKWPRQALEFYLEFWGHNEPGVVADVDDKGRRRFVRPDAPKKSNRQFFNYCKILINAFDKRNTMEIYSAEAMTRYISGMNYGLLISLCLMLFNYLFFGNSMTSLLLSGMYLAAIGVIMVNFRFIRFKEVETVFVAMMVNYGKYLDLQTSTRPPQAPLAAAPPNGKS